MKRKISIISLLIIPIVAVMIAQGIVSIGTLKINGADRTLENNAVNMMSRTVENRKVILENKMLEQWSFVANEAETDQAAEYNGFFVRDADSGDQSFTNTDLIMERGGKTLARTEGIPLDSAWTTKFSFLGNGMRKADDFFYQPYLAARSNPETAQKYLGYWAEPFVLEDHYMDNHKMIAYSVPISCDNMVFGVLGVEVSTSLLEQNQNGFYQVEDVKIGKQKVYATVHAMNLYSNHVPYSDTHWVLIGFETENAIFGASRNIFIRMMLAVALGVLFGVLMVGILVGSVMRPIARLVNSVRGGVEGIHGFHKSGIREIDEIHEVVETLTDEQQQAEERIQEESEKYRMAVENSTDIFYTYDYAKQTLEIVNSKEMNGIWNIWMIVWCIRMTENGWRNYAGTVRKSSR